MYNLAKKAILVIIVTLISVFSTFAYDGTVIESTKLGSYDENIFVKAVSDDSQMVRNLLKEAFPNNPVNLVYQLKYENLDDDNRQIITDIENYILGQYKLNDKDTFFHIIMKDNTKSLADGWVIYSNYSKSHNFAHIIYYFSLY